MAASVWRQFKCSVILLPCPQYNFVQNVHLLVLAINSLKFHWNPLSICVKRKKRRRWHGTYTRTTGHRENIVTFTVHSLQTPNMPRFHVDRSIVSWPDARSSVSEIMPYGLYNLCSVLLRQYSAGLAYRHTAANVPIRKTCRRPVSKNQEILIVECAGMFEAVTCYLSHWFEGKLP